MAVQNNTYANMQEEELKNKIRKDFFDYKDLDADKIIGKIDFCVSLKKSQDKANNLAQDEISNEARNASQDEVQDTKTNKQINLLWAEAKKGVANPIDSFIQLILTIGKAKTNENFLPPTFLGAFDSQKINFIQYHEIQKVFTLSDFNWKVTPSDHNSKEFALLKDLLENIIAKNKMEFYFKESAKLKEFIKLNFSLKSTAIYKIQITKNNFTYIYQDWLKSVKNTIGVNWDKAKKRDILDSDFFLADLFSENNETLKDSLSVILKTKVYEMQKKQGADGLFIKETAEFNDNQKAHTAFWNLYERPPREEYWDYIIERRDLLVPSDVRERKGSFFTPQIWVEKAQEYLESSFGTNYQDEYIIWDCAAGTGNLLTNLANSSNIFASTFDKADVKIMQDLADSKNLPLLRDHIFQFDFLNDSFFDSYCPMHQDNNATNEREKENLKNARQNCQYCQDFKSKLPTALQEILLDPAKREKLIIFINPPYAEATSTRTTSGTMRHRALVSTDNAIYQKYRNEMGKASNELFAQFFFRIYKEIEGCKLASFSTTKHLNAMSFIKFRQVFKAKFLKGFLCPANTFDNVNGSFPIAFIVWDLAVKEEIKKITLDVFYAPKKLEERALRGKDDKAQLLGKKTFYAHTGEIINKWMRTFNIKNSEKLGILHTSGNEFQTQQVVCLLTTFDKNSHYILQDITKYNLIVCAIYLAVRHCIKANWLNWEDQFLAPKDSWLKDSEFHFNCLAFALFHGKNRISSHASAGGVKGLGLEKNKNHFIPFSEMQINAKEKFASDFMYKFLQGKIGKDLAGGVKGNYLDGRSDSGGGSSNLTCEAGDVSDSGGLRDSIQNGGAGASHTTSDVKGRGLESNESATQSLGGESNKNRAFADKQEKTESKNIDSSLFESQNETLKLLINLIPQKPVIFSELAQKVMDAGREFFKYYHESASKPPKFSFDDGYNRSYNANVSLYDIKAHFQGFKNKKMNPPQKAQDEHYKILLSDLNNALENLADEIAHKCYEHEFLLV